LTDFIDFHVHPPVTELIEGPLAPYLGNMDGCSDSELESLSVDEVAAHYRDRDGRAVLLGWDTETVTRRRPFSSEDVAAMVEAHPGVFVGFGSIDPARGARAVAAVHAAARLGLVGIAFHPTGQGFDPTSTAAFPIYEAAGEHGLICLFHTGYSRLGAGHPGGAGLQLTRSNPLAVDAIAAAFPDLSIVIAHLGRLWQDEAIAVAAHKANVWLNLVGASAHAFQGDHNRLGDLDLSYCLFGSDWCFSSLDRALAGWDAGTVDPAMRRLILHDNAARLLESAGR
jgi:predicted TIM-barrel fold metal-dependent hydrolase